MKPERALDERGAATIMAVLLIGFLAFVMVACVLIAGVLVSHRKAQSGADLAALAAASEVQRGGGGCAAAARIAARNRTEVISCRLLASTGGVGQDALIRVRAEVNVWWGGSRWTEAEARAGPVGWGASGLAPR